MEARRQRLRARRRSVPRSARSICHRTAGSATNRRRATAWCATARAANCGRNYEGLCLTEHAGYVASKADGHLYPVTGDAELVVERAGAIAVAEPGHLADCAYDDRNALRGQQPVRPVDRVARRSTDEAKVVPIASIGVGFPEVLAVRGDVFYRMSDTGGSPSLMAKFRCSAICPLDLARAVPVLQRRFERDRDPGHRRWPASSSRLHRVQASLHDVREGRRAGPQGAEARRRARAVRRRQAVSLAATRRGASSGRARRRSASASRATSKRTLVDSGRKSIPWHEIVALALERLRNIDPISEQRLAANYTDESGAVRLADTAPLGRVSAARPAISTTKSRPRSAEAAQHRAGPPAPPAPPATEARESAAPPPAPLAGAAGAQHGTAADRARQGLQRTLARAFCAALLATLHRALRDVLDDALPIEAGSGTAGDVREQLVLISSMDAPTSIGCAAIASSSLDVRLRLRRWADLPPASAAATFTADDLSRDASDRSFA